MGDDTSNPDGHRLSGSLASFFSRVFRAPDVEDKGLETLDTQAMMQRVDATMGLMNGRANAVIVAASVVFSAAVTLLGSGDGTKWLLLPSAVFGGASLALSVWSQLTFVGQTLALSPDIKVADVKGRLAKKLVLNAYALLCLGAGGVLVLLGSAIRT